MSFIAWIKKTFEPLYYVGLLIPYKIKGCAFDPTHIFPEVVNMEVKHC